MLHVLMETFITLSISDGGLPNKCYVAAITDTNIYAQKTLVFAR